jgi:hypothetical protein
MAMKSSLIAGALTLAFNAVPIVAQAGCFDLPCPPEPKPAPAAVHWRVADFPPPNGGRLVFRLLSNGTPECASYDGANCLWGQSANQINFNRVKPLICGANHRAVWGVTGFENPKHWCRMANTVSAMILD